MACGVAVMQWIRKHTYAESSDGMYQIRRISRTRDKCAVFRWDERYGAHCRYIGQGTEQQCKATAEAIE